MCIIFIFENIHDEMLRSQVRVLAPDDGEQQLLVDAARAGHHPRPRLPVRTVAAPLAAAGVYHNLGVRLLSIYNLDIYAI